MEHFVPPKTFLQYMFNITLIKRNTVSSQTQRLFDLCKHCDFYLNVYIIFTKHKQRNTVLHIYI